MKKKIIEKWAFFAPRNPCNPFNKRLNKKKKKQESIYRPNKRKLVYYNDYYFFWLTVLAFPQFVACALVLFDK